MILLVKWQQTLYYLGHLTWLFKPCEMSTILTFVLIIEICQSTNYFISVPLPLCTKLNGPNYIIHFRKEISISGLSLGWKLLNPNETLKDRCPYTGETWERMLQNEWSMTQLNCKILWSGKQLTYMFLTTENQTET